MVVCVLIITYLVSLLLAKLRKQRVSVLLKAYALYPVYLFELFSVFLQVGIFFGNFYFIRYLPLIKMLHLGVYIIPVIAYGLYKQALVGSGCVLLGTAMNRLVMHANGGKMPVFPTLSHWTGYYSAEGFAAPGSIHTVGDASTKLAFLADYIDIGYSILSLGDLVIRIYVILILYYTVVRLNGRLHTPGLPADGQGD